MEWEGDRYHMGPLHVVFLKSMDPKSTQLLENLRNETNAFGGPLFSVTPRYRCFALFGSLASLARCDMIVVGDPWDIPRKNGRLTCRGMILQESSSPQISQKRAV